MNLTSIFEAERKTPDDSIAKREQIAGMLQKLIKTETDVSLISNQITDGFSTLLGPKFLLNEHSSLIRRRSAACIANITSLESPLVHAILRNNRALESVVSMLRQYGGGGDASDDESAVQAIQHASLCLLNMMSIGEENQRYFVREKLSVDSISDCLGSFVRSSDKWHDSLVSDIIANLMIVLSLLALNESLCVQMCQPVVNPQNSTVLLVCHILKSTTAENVSDEVLEACSALLWNNALCEATRPITSEHIDEHVMNKLISMSKSSNQKLRNNSNHVIQILSTVASTQQFLTNDIPSLIHGLRGSKTEDILHSAGTIWNIACGAEARQEIENLAGEEALVLQIKRLLSSDVTQDTLQLMYKITGALSALTLSESISLKLGKLGCIELLFQILKSSALQQNISISENALSVLSNLAINEENRTMMRTMDQIQFLVAYLDPTKKGHVSEVSGEEEQLFKLAERASNVLISISVENSGGDMIRQAGGIEKLVHLVKTKEAQEMQSDGSPDTPNSRYTKAKRTATTVLWNLSLNDDNMKLIEDLDGIKPLVSMLPQTKLDDTIFLNNVKKTEEQDKQYDEAAAAAAVAKAIENDSDEETDESSDSEDSSLVDPSSSEIVTELSSDTTATPVQIPEMSVEPVASVEEKVEIMKLPPRVPPQRKVVIPAVNLAAAAEAARQTLQELTLRESLTPKTPHTPKTPKVMPTRVPVAQIRSLANTKLARLNKKWEHIKLLIDSEREYIELLAWMDQNFMALNSFVMRNNMIDEQAHSDMFQDMDCLRMVNLDLYIELEKTYLEYKDNFKERDEQIMIGSILTKRSPTLRLYKTYANNLKRAIDTLSLQMNNKSEFNEFVAKQCEEIRKRSSKLNEYTKKLFFNTDNKPPLSPKEESKNETEVSVDNILQDLLLKKPIERVNFYVLWLEEMINVHMNTNHPDQKYLKEADKQLGMINDYCVKKIQQLEQLDLFAKLLNEHPFSQKQKKFFLMKNVGFPEPQGYQGYHVWSRSYEKRLAKSYKAWSNYKGPIDSKATTVRKLIARYGVVPLMRPRVWMALSGAQRKMEENVGYYQKILLSGSKSLSPKVVEDIEKDMKRTYHDHPFFQEENSPVFSAMRRIFVAYSTRNPLVNYSQSFNYICGLLLLHMSEEEAFWLFVCIIEDFLPQNFYSPNLKGVLVDASILDELIYQHHSKIAVHFKRLGFELSAFTMAFMMKLYSSDFPYETTLRIWDKLFLEGAIVLFKVPLSLLKINESALLKAPDVSSLMLCFQNMIVKPCFDVDKLLKTADKYDKKVNIQKIDSLRKKYSSLIDTELKR